jgi:DNA-binding CsgD family transcriptional regulator
VLPGLPRAENGGWDDHHTSAVIAAPHQCLSPREREVLVQIAGGRSNKQIAQQLSLSIRTVERHINNIYRKIDAQNKADATAWALRHNLA